MVTFSDSKGWETTPKKKRPSACWIISCLVLFNGIRLSVACVCPPALAFRH